MWKAEVVDGCSVEWREGGHGPNSETLKRGSNGAPRRLRSVQVRRTGKDTCEFTRPKSGKLVVKRICGKHLRVTGPDGADVLARWRGADYGGY
jgi:hypothetical protein